MRPTRRFWALAGAAGAFALLAVVLAAPLYVGVTAVLAGWLVAAQVAFTADLAATQSAIAVSQTATPDRVLEAQAVDLAATASLERSTWAAYELTVHPPLNADADPASTRLDAESSHVQVAATFDVAGRYTVQRPTLTARGPLGLFTETLPVGSTTSITVAPSAPHDAVVLADGDRVSVGYGTHDTHYGASGFAAGDLRQYVPGDPANRIDWKTTARMNEPYVRNTDPETDRETLAFVDHRHSLGDGRAGRTQLDYLREVALWLVDHAAEFGDPLGYHAVGDDGTTAARAPRSTRSHYATVKHGLYDLAPTAPVDGRARDRSAATPRSIETESAFGATLAPFLEAGTAYVDRIEADPLFHTVRTELRRQARTPWVVVLTDDANRAELLETVQVATQQNAPVTVFLAPGALFGDPELPDLERAYEAYRDFREFYATLARVDGATVYEVGPADRIDAVLTARDPVDQEVNP